MCRYLLRRCDNSPAPWDSGTVGDGAWSEDLPEEATKEMKNGKDVHKPKGQPFWDYVPDEEAWKWVRPAPVAAEKKAYVKKPTAKKEENAVCTLSSCACSSVTTLQVCDCRMCMSLNLCTASGGTAIEVEFWASCMHWACGAFYWHKRLHGHMCLLDAATMLQLQLKIQYLLCRF